MWINPRGLTDATGKIVLALVVKPDLFGFGGIRFGPFHVRHY